MTSSNEFSQSRQIDDLPSKAPLRALAVLKSKPGRGPDLEAFTRSVLPQIRGVPGLIKVEFSRDLLDPEHFVLYYWWQSEEASKAYTAGPEFASIAPRLRDMVAEHSLFLAKRLD